MLNTALLVILVGLIIYIGAILTYEFLDLNDFPLFHRKPQYTPISAEEFIKGVTLGDLCQLCPKSTFVIKDNDGGFFKLETEAVSKQKLKLYKEIFVKKLDAETYTLEVSAPWLL